MSPGLTPRPSLSDGRAAPSDCAARVSPGLTPRPSLSVGHDHERARDDLVSPGLTPRPSLSAARGHRRDWDRRRRVAGAHAPALLERGRFPCRPCSCPAVSPGLTPRPSLSVPDVQAGRQLRRQVSPGLTPRPSLSGGPVVVKFGSHHAAACASCSSSRPTMSRMLHSRSVTPAFMAGDMRIVWWIRANLTSFPGMQPAA